MTQSHRRIGFLVLAVVVVATGCAWTRPPYSDDPLLRRRSGPRPLTDLIPGLRSATQPTTPTDPVSTPHDELSTEFVST